MYTIRNKNLLDHDGTVVLRVVNKLESFQHSRVISSDGSYRLASGNLPPGATGKTVAWLEERTSEGSRPLTARVPLARLPHITRLVKWITDVKSVSTAGEVSEQLDLLLAWQWIHQDSSAKSIYRIYRDIWAALTANKVPVQNARVREICRAYGAVTGFRDSSDVTDVIFGLDCLLREYDLYRTHPAARNHMPGSQPKAEDKRAVTSYWVALDDYLTYLSKYEHLSSSWIHRGQLHSYRGERSLATRCFDRAVQINGELVDRCGSEMGAYTYGEPSLSSEDISRREIIFVEEPNAEANPDSSIDVTVLYSANIEFLRQYLPRILYYASALPAFRYHIHLVDKTDECLRFIDESNDLLRSIISMRRVATSTVRLRWSYENLPSAVGNPKTYYACARFIHAEKIMDRYGSPVWIQDADIFPTGPTDVFGSQLGETDVTLNKVKFLHGFVPWKRFLAGSVYIADSEEGRKFVFEAARYIESFLGIQSSWTLDQNALDWAVESTRGQIRLADGSMMGIPLTQTAMSRYIERPTG